MSIGSITTGSITTATTQAQLPTAQVSQALLNSARIQLHFLKHQCFLHHSPLLEAAPNIHLPVTIVQGALDLVCPPITAWRLSQRLPQATLRLISSAGHSALSGNLAMALKAEVDALRDRRFDRQHGYHMGRAAE
jgi:proline iminopeptidase